MILVSYTHLDFVWIPYCVAVKMSRNANITNYTFTALDTSKADECTTAVSYTHLDVYKRQDLDSRIFTGAPKAVTAI